jgi:CRISPR-associated protein Cas2
MDYAVVYDISNDKERRKVDKILKGFGFRIQKSVFECRLSKKGKVDLVKALERLDIKTGFIKLYRLEYSTKNVCIGDERKESVDNGPAFIV